MEKYKFNIDQRIQEKLEDRVKLIINEAKNIEEKTIKAKSEKDEQIKSDIDAFDIIKKTSKGVYVISEEGNYGDKKCAVIEVWDPIDGSSEYNRIGEKKSPLTTAGIVIYKNSIAAVSIGDIWNEKIYGLDISGLYFKVNKEKKYITISEEKLDKEDFSKRELKSLDKVFVAAYAPSLERLKIILPLFEVCPYVHNNGGQPFALRVVEGKSIKSYSAALEAKPVGLWEHIGPLMAEYAGASVSRLDGSPLELNSNLKQTSITAVNDEIRENIINTLKPNYEKLGILHVTK